MDILAIDGSASIWKDRVRNYRSSYEATFGTWCTRNNINYQYEPFIFKLSNGRSYVPDFYLPFHRVFVEVKGLWEGSAKTKFRLFAKESMHGIYLLDHKALMLLNKTKEDKIACGNCMRCD